MATRPQTVEAAKSDKVECGKRMAKRTSSSAVTDGRPLALKTVIEEHPAKSSHSGGLHKIKNQPLPRSNCWSETHNVGVDDGETGLDVGGCETRGQLSTRNTRLLLWTLTESRSTVEAEPSNPAAPTVSASLLLRQRLELVRYSPKEDGTLNHERHVVRLEGEEVGSETATLA